MIFERNFKSIDKHRNIVEGLLTWELPASRLMIFLYLRYLNMKII